jgi:signal transduction histidine kinase
MIQLRGFLSRHALDVALIVAIVMALEVDAVYHPRLEVPVLFVIPVAIAAIRWDVRPILIVVASVAAVAFYDLVHYTSSMLMWNGYLWGLMIVTLVALVLADQRNRTRHEARRQQQVIHDVERLRQPLTVIVGYAQLILTRSEAGTAACRRATATIAREANKMRRMLCDIIAEGTPPDR